MHARRAAVVRGIRLTMPSKQLSVEHFARSSTVYWNMGIIKAIFLLEKGEKSIWCNAVYKLASHESTVLWPTWRNDIRVHVDIVLRVCCFNRQITQEVNRIDDILVMLASQALIFFDIYTVVRFLHGIAVINHIKNKASMVMMNLIEEGFEHRNIRPQNQDSCIYLTRDKNGNTQSPIPGIHHVIKTLNMTHSRWLENNKSYDVWRIYVKSVELPLYVSFW